MGTPAKSEPRRESGVLLLNLGGPETLDDVRPFLYNLFSDPEIIRIRSSLLRKSLAWLIATLRQRKSRDLYRQIGGGSPLRRITEGQALALAGQLASLGHPANVYVGMRCWKPTIDDALALIRRDGVRRLLVLPLFPQFSLTTTGSCFNYLRMRAAESGLQNRIEIEYIDAWYDDPLYLEAMAELIREGLSEFTGADPSGIHLLFSAHSIPERYVAAGDPYLRQTRETVELILKRLGAAAPWDLAFQSKVGPVKWLGPPTEEVIRDLGRKGVARLLVTAVSFVSDHIETLQEIDIDYRQLARESGIREFRRAPAPNLHPKFIRALGEISVKRL